MLKQSVISWSLVGSCLVSLIACANDGTELESGPREPRSSPTAAVAAPSAPPGTEGAEAFRFFETSGHSAMSACASCHSSGSNGAPIFFGADVKSTYKALDGNGLILATSPLLTKGPHAGGAAPALEPNAEATVRKWLDLEAKERAGKAPESIYTTLGNCMSAELFAKIDLCTAKTQPRPGESGDYCTGCKYESCSNCHAAGGQSTGFWCSAKTEGGKTVTDSTDTLSGSRGLPYIRRYFGFAGSDPVASNAILNKSKTTQSATTLVAHPWFTLDAARQKALNAFVEDALSRYRSGTCTP